MFIKNFFAVLAFILLTVSSAQADLLGDLCDDLYAKIENQNVGTTATKTFYQKEILPEVIRVMEAQIQKEVVEYYSIGAGSQIRTSGMSDEEKTDLYLSSKSGILKARKNALRSLQREKYDEHGNRVMIEVMVLKDGLDMNKPGVLNDPNNIVLELKPDFEDNLENMSNGAKLKAFITAHYRYSRHEAYSNINSIKDESAKKEFHRYQSWVYQQVLGRVVRTFDQGTGVLKYIYN